MLQKITINGFRSCRDVVMDNLGPLVVLEGRNSVGKTNVLRGIHWASTNAVLRGTVLPPSVNPPYLPNTSVCFEVEIGTIVFKYSISANDIRMQLEPSATLKESVSTRTDSGVWEEIICRDGPQVRVKDHHPFEIPSMAPCLPALASILPRDDPAMTKIKTLITYLESIRYYSLDEPNELPPWNSAIPEEEYRSWLTIYRATGNPSDSIAYRLIHMHAEAPDKIQELKSLLGRDGLGLIDDFTVQKIEFDNKKFDVSVIGSRTWHFLEFIPSKSAGGNPRGFKFGDLSLGTRRIIRILVSMLFDESSVMLIEHPEDGIHTGLTKKLISLLRKYAVPGQYIISSHSLVIFNTVRPEDVRLVTMRDGVTHLRPLSPRELEAAETFMKEEGTLADVIESIEE